MKRISFSYENNNRNQLSRISKNARYYSSLSYQNQDYRDKNLLQELNEFINVSCSKQRINYVWARKLFIFTPEILHTTHTQSEDTSSRQVGARLVFGWDLREWQRQDVE